jgi:hypothetical protein
MAQGEMKEFLGKKRRESRKSEKLKRRNAVWDMDWVVQG